MNEWINVNDKLPNDEESVLCFCMGNLMRVYTFYSYKNEWEDDYGYLEADDIITHWMPLPKFPKEENNGSNNY